MKSTSEHREQLKEYLRNSFDSEHKKETEAPEKNIVSVHKNLAGFYERCLESSESVKKIIYKILDSATPCNKLLLEAVEKKFQKYKYTLCVKIYSLEVLEIIQNEKSDVFLKTREDIKDVVANSLGGSDKNLKKMVEYSAMFHDIGKLVIPNEILEVPSRPDIAQWLIIKAHTIFGFIILDELKEVLEKVIGEDNFLSVINVARTHHNNIPENIFRTVVPVKFEKTFEIVTTIVKIADNFDAILAVTLNERKYQGDIGKTKTIEDAIMTTGKRILENYGNRMQLDISKPVLEEIVKKLSKRVLSHPEKYYLIDS